MEAELASLSVPEIKVHTQLLNNEREVLETETRIIGYKVREWEDKTVENERSVKVGGVGLPCDTGMTNQSSALQSNALPCGQRIGNA